MAWNDLAMEQTVNRYSSVEMESVSIAIDLLYENWSERVDGGNNQNPEKSLDQKLPGHCMPNFRASEFTKAKGNFRVRTSAQ